MRLKLSFTMVAILFMAWMSQWISQEVVHVMHSHSHGIRSNCHKTPLVKGRPFRINENWCGKKRHAHRRHRGTILSLPQCVNTLRPRQNGRHFADNILKCIFLNENVWIPIEISLKFVPKGPIDNIPALVLIMAWCRPGDKPLSEPMMVCLLTHIWVTQSQWVKTLSCFLFQYKHSLKAMFIIQENIQTDFNDANVQYT